jgi:hypothetical protein
VKGCECDFDSVIKVTIVRSDFNETDRTCERVTGTREVKVSLTWTEGEARYREDGQPSDYHHVM